MNNPPAFPGIEGSHASADEYNNPYTAIDSYEGMTLRDYFAAKAMCLTFVAGIAGQIDDKSARAAYQIADAMLKARENK